MFIPANREDLARKAARTSPDLVILDLEDAVPAAAKEEARGVAQRCAAILVADGMTTVIRTNAPSTAWFLEDAAFVRSLGLGAVVPKVESADAVRAALPGTPCIAGLETVKAVEDAARILVGFAGCYFGAEDYIADLGGFRTASNAEVARARAQVAVAARVAGAVALDMVTLDFHDRDRFVAEAREAGALGYRGKLCIHPTQVGLAQQAFAPSEGDLRQAEAILEVYEAALLQGRATASHEGSMVDEVVARLARATLERAAAR